MNISWDSIPFMVFFCLYFFITTTLTLLGFVIHVICYILSFIYFTPYSLYNNEIASINVDAEFISILILKLGPGGLKVREVLSEID